MPGLKGREREGLKGRELWLYQIVCACTKYRVDRIVGRGLEGGEMAIKDVPGEICCVLMSSSSVSCSVYPSVVFLYSW